MAARARKKKSERLVNAVGESKSIEKNESDQKILGLNRSRLPVKSLQLLQQEAVLIKIVYLH